MTGVQTCALPISVLATKTFHCMYKVWAVLNPTPEQVLGLGLRVSPHCQFSLIHIFLQSKTLPCRYHCITLLLMPTLNEVSLLTETLVVCPYFYPLHSCCYPIVPLGLFDGRIAATVGTSFVRTQPDRYFPSTHQAELKLRAGIRYGHLAAI